MGDGTAYAVAACVRLVAALSPGYVHPDEVFQGLEVMAASMLTDAAGDIPWEFADCETPYRSSVPP